MMKYHLELEEHQIVQEEACAEKQWEQEVRKENQESFWFTKQLEWERKKYNTKHKDKKEQSRESKEEEICQEKKI